jgi:hypothetical protein
MGEQLLRFGRRKDALKAVRVQDRLPPCRTDRVNRPPRGHDDRAGAAVIAVACVGRPWTPQEARGQKGAAGDFDRQEAKYDYDKRRAGKATSVVVDLDRRYQVLDGFGAAHGLVPRSESSARRPTASTSCSSRSWGSTSCACGTAGTAASRRQQQPLEVEVEIIRAGDQGPRSPAEGAAHFLVAAVVPEGETAPSAARSNPDCTLIKKRARSSTRNSRITGRSRCATTGSAGSRSTSSATQNEPDFTPPDWEGCRFNPGGVRRIPRYDRALAAVHRKLQRCRPAPADRSGVHRRALRQGRELPRPARSEPPVRRRPSPVRAGRDGVWDWRDPGPDSYADELRAVGIATPEAPLANRVRHR